MRNWKNWLAPILTGLTVVALALLPLRLSTLQDERLTGTVHTEPLAEDSNFPAKPPELPRRLLLLAQQRELADTLTIIGQELEGAALTESTELGRGELADLVVSGVLPKYLDPDNAELFAGKVYLRDQTDLSSAGFIRLDGYDRDSGEYRSLVIDAETGLLVEVELDSIWILKDTPDPAALGAAFLDRLGLEYQTFSHDPLLACFRLQDGPVLYYATISRTTLHIGPWLDWEALELSGSRNETLGGIMDSSIRGNRT
ncbi:hypothetical protein [Oscillibacter sp. 1-3]|uniref:hypothetical protein n=1 Tax=Oscillibacter sp. 1-3 TaxID=1235797 RepID=UPI000340E7BE|nr:hypothetical protein [Oscillibacter sp. 1-3]EOS64230.1 hypothetical protein C816_03097 [Oscillibacter sp. 1-3]